MKTKTTVLITGATGVMGYETLREFSGHLDEFELRLLVRDSKKNRKKLAKYLTMDGVTAVWGDLLDRKTVAEAVKGSDYVLHMGGMVSPLADHYPEKTMKVNVGGTKNIVEVIKENPEHSDIRLVYIGSVAQTSHRYYPCHWGRTGDPILAGVYDYYSLSKILAEREVAESGLKYWVSLRQSGILHKGLISKGSDPLTFHVPLRGVLEWTTIEDSARLMVGVCRKEVPDTFWRGFYNIGSGKEFRLTNYEFECELMRALHCPPPEKVFETNWFATRNFHGMWYDDSDYLNGLIPFREKITAKDYFRRMAGEMPWWINLSPLAPALLIKLGMKRVALSKGLGTLDWVRRDDCEKRIKAFFKSREERDKISGWDRFDTGRLPEEHQKLSHGYDESKPDSELDIEDMRQAASFRGGECQTEEMTRGDLDTKLAWRCAFGHNFHATPRLVLKGGHWCPECMPQPWRYDAEAKLNPFMAQVWYASHSVDEDEEYG